MRKTGVLLDLHEFLLRRLIFIFRIIKSEQSFYSLVLLIFILTFFFRLFNYENRIHLQADNSQDVQVARYAFDNLLLPLSGPFSSAGPFHYGPWYFWFLEIISIFPFGLLTHWYPISLLHIIFVGLVFLLGKEVGGRWVGIFASLFAAISPVQIDSSLTVWNPSVVPTISLLSLMFLIKFFKDKKVKDIFLLNFFIGLGVTIHFQIALLVPISISSILLIKPGFKNYIKFLPYAFSGFILPFLPMIYLDSNLGWYNLKSIFIFLAIDQFNSWVPNRWLTYVFDYWPNTWAFVMGGNKVIVYILSICILIFSLIRLKRIKEYRIYYLVAFVFLAEVIAYRYYRGQRFQYYSFFAHPSIFVLSSWAVYQLLAYKKILGVALLTLVISFTLRSSIILLKERSVSLSDFKTVKEEIFSMFPSSKFNIYGCYSNANATSHPAALLIYYEHKDSSDGVKIGLCEDKEKITWEPILSFKDDPLQKKLWYERSTYKVYYDTAEWFLKYPPKSGGNFWDFLKKNFSLQCYPHC